MVAILSNQREVIFEAVRRMYTEVAVAPGREFHFPTGRKACEFVGYPAADLDQLPASALESFAGVGYPFAAGVIQDADTVLDIGSGSGTDGGAGSFAAVKAILSTSCAISGCHGNNGGTMHIDFRDNAGLYMRLMGNAPNTAPSACRNRTIVMPGMPRLSDTPTATIVSVLRLRSSMSSPVPPKGEMPW